MLQVTYLVKCTKCNLSLLAHYMYAFPSHLHWIPFICHFYCQLDSIYEFIEHYQDSECFQCDGKIHTLKNFFRLLFATSFQKVNLLSAK